LRLHPQPDRGQGRPAVERQFDLRTAVERLGRITGLGQPGRQGHGEAAGVRGRDQFFRVGALLPAKAGGEAVTGTVEQAALRRGERPPPRLQVAFPVGAGPACDGHPVSPRTAQAKLTRPSVTSAFAAAMLRRNAPRRCAGVKVDARHGRPGQRLQAGIAPAGSHDGRPAVCSAGAGRTRPAFPTTREERPMSYTTEQIRNVALAGHPGAGKTTLFEALLHAGGAIQAAGSVERGNTVSDFDPIEKRRGHSIDAAIASVDHDGIHLNLVDLPGYPDFRGPALSALGVVETAAIVVDAVPGVEYGTRRMMARAKERGLCR